MWLLLNIQLRSTGVFSRIISGINSIFMKKLIGFAGILRALLNAESIFIPVKHEEYGFDQSVGQLSKNDNTEPLSFREACNKIIHANQYEIKFSYSEVHPLDNGRNGYGSAHEKYKNPIIVTYGEYRNVPWISNLEFLKFIDMSINPPLRN